MTAAMRLDVPATGTATSGSAFEITESLGAVFEDYLLRVRGLYPLQTAISKATAASEVVDTRDKIEQAIVTSHAIVALGDDWDDAGSVGYSEATWARATAFLRDLASLDPSLPVPMISPAGAGSIDLYWRDGDRRTLLINFPADGNAGSYFGKSPDGATTKGQLGAKKTALHLATWLKQ